MSVMIIMLIITFTSSKHFDVHGALPDDNGDDIYDDDDDDDDDDSHVHHENFKGTGDTV